MLSSSMKQPLGIAVAVSVGAAIVFYGARPGSDGINNNEQGRRALRVLSNDPKSVVFRGADFQAQMAQAQFEGGHAGIEQPKTVDEVYIARTRYPETAQMGTHQIDHILSVLPPDGNLLVWGLGNDSPSWNSYTTGRVAFLEDDEPFKKNGVLWYDEITAKYPYLEAYKVHYTTKNDEPSYAKFMENPESDELEIPNFPKEVADVAWDVIIVDAPLGQTHRGPARYQSIYATLQLARNQLNAGGKPVSVFVDDYERKVERDFSRRAFGGKEPVAVTTRAKGVSNANEQAHFVLSAEDCVIRDPASCGGQQAS